jgi:murein DD-endopeptidase MepM/ murein hydrolase activator NlpD
MSLRRAFLKAPLKFSRISSRFSNSRLHPVLRIRRPHHGVDYAAPKGTPVHSIGSGTVTESRYAGGAGRMIKIRHNSTYSTAYLHLSGYGPGIKSGARVQQGQVIGYVGSSGLSTGPHLDFRFYKNGTPVDPLKVESPPALPVKKELMDSFNIVRLQLSRQLDSLSMPKKKALKPL